MLHEHNPFLRGKQWGISPFIGSKNPMLLGSIIEKPRK
jgi:hypothetical protein